MQYTPSAVSDGKGTYMIQLGREQNLEVLRTTSIGVYLGEARDPLAVFSRSSSANDSSLTDRTDILLPKNEIKTGLNVGDTVRAFVYLDSEDRPIATLKAPMLTIGSFAMLTVKDITKIGAFLDWGLAKDLFLPYREMTAQLKAGDKVLVTLYVDKSKRLCATMKLYRHLRTDSDYEKSDWVDGTVYELSDEHGAYVAVDDLFSGMIPARELMRPVKVGEALRLRITKIHEDGKLELSMREPGYLQLGPDCETVFNRLKASYTGFLPFHDRSDADEIKAEFNMSKNSFKRAIGHLMKDGLIDILDNGIKLKER